MTIQTNMGAPDGFVLRAKACDRRQLVLQQPSILATTDVHGPRILCSRGIRSIALAAIAVLCATSASAASGGANVTYAERSEAQILGVRYFSWDLDRSVGLV
jgi:hypothetical protein